MPTVVRTSPSWAKPVLWLLARTFGMAAGLLAVLIVTGGSVVGLIVAFITGRFFDTLGFWRWLYGPTQFNEGWGPETDIFFTGMLHVAVCVVACSYLFRVGWWIAKR